MSKTTKITAIDIKSSVMRKVKTNEIKMKPRWVFIVGSLVSIVGIVASGVVTSIMLSIVFFSIRARGLMGQWKIQQLMSLFPWWALVVAIVGIVVGIVLLKKYDFFYKRNFIWIVAAVIFSFIVSAYILDKLGVTAILTQRGPMNRFYQLQEKTPLIQQGSGLQNKGNGKHLYRQNE